MRHDVSQALGRVMEARKLDPSERDELLARYAEAGSVGELPVWIRKYAMKPATARLRAARSVGNPDDEEPDDEDDEDFDVLYPSARSFALTTHARHRELLMGGVLRAGDDPDDELRAADPEALHHYWTRGKGLAKWAKFPHPWTALYRRLRKYVGSERAKRMAAQWHKEVFGIWPGEKKGQNPVGPG